MKPDKSQLCLNIQNGTNGEVFVVPHFFDFSVFTQEAILSDKILPLLHDGHNVYLNIGSN